MQACDAVTVERLCRAEDQAAALRADLEEHGGVLKRPLIDPRGGVAGTEFYANPALVPLRRIGAEAASLARELGLSPAGRAALGLDVLTKPQDKPDELKRLRAQREARLARQAAARGASS